MIHKAKKSLGQNFLKSEPALNMMCEAGSVNGKDIVVEIGPGKGALTFKLLEKAGKVIAVEKDRDLIEILKERFEKEIKNKKLEIINGDILEFDPKSVGIKEGEYKIIANIPYNITGAIIRRFLADTIEPSTMVLLVQKEVAQRIVARDNKESILSLSVKAYGTPAYMMKVGKRFFSPSPKVDSGIIAITDISKKNFTPTPSASGHSPSGSGRTLEEKFFTVVKSAFAHKRKVLRKNLEEVADAKTIDSVFKKLNIDAKIRAEDVPSHLWLDITRLL